ncbi:MAG: sigma-70 family RNA polymerase sigma factor [Bacteroidetes bacterium]|nr:sigma-70 family RNA polymerase sigma factor [Bacteroidota bacterium]
MPEFSEQTLLKRFAENDSQATEIIYKDHFNMIRHLIQNNNGDHEDAKDIFQEAMIVLYENARTDSFILNCQLKTYLYSICRRLWLKRLQQAGRMTVLTEGIEETTQVDDAMDHHQRLSAEFALMEKAMNNLGEPCKSLLEAYYLEKKGMDEIADKFGYTNADNAKNQKYKCMIRLKKIFFAHYNHNGK